jgi:hypothetical protein
MATCPRCSLSVPAYSRCDCCGLVLGFEGITLLIELEDSPHCDRIRRLAQLEDSCSEWREENGRRLLRVTYSHAELDRCRQLATAAANLPRKHSFLNGLEIRWPAAPPRLRFLPRLPALSRLLFHRALHRAARVSSASN